MIAKLDDLTLTLSAPELVAATTTDEERRVLAAILKRARVERQEFELASELRQIERRFTMSTRKELGKITSAKFGIGGYQDAMIGLTIGIGGTGWGTCGFIGGWCPEEGDDTERTKCLNSICVVTVRKVAELLNQAHKVDVSRLVGVPVEVTWEDGGLKSWRILTEVL